MTFAEHLKAERARLGLSQPKMRELLGLKMRAYWDYEQGITIPVEIAQEGAIARLAKVKDHSMAMEIIRRRNLEKTLAKL